MTLMKVLFVEARLFISAASLIGTMVNFASGFPNNSPEPLTEMTEAVDWVLWIGGNSLPGGGRLCFRPSPASAARCKAFISPLFQGLTRLKM